MKFKCDVWVGVKCPIKEGYRYKKLWLEPELTRIYQETGKTPREGHILPCGEVVIGKGSDNESIILFIKKKKKEINEHPLCMD